jgi:multiple sugar transport system ATP-binding protein
MNMLHGRISGGAFVDAGGQRWPMPPGHRGTEGAEVVYGIRPEHLRLDRDGITATVHVIEPTGSETQVIMKIGGASVMGAFRERITEKPGDPMPVSPDVALVHLFDKSTGQRI